MTRRTTLSNREYHLLMAYLDGELSPRARARVEARLREDDTWQEALQGARALKAALGQLPRARAPRPFTLTPAQAETVRRPRRQMQMAYRWAGALAALLFAVLLLGRGLAGIGMGSTAALPPQNVNMAAPPDVFSEAKAAVDEEMPAAAPASVGERSADTESLTVPETTAFTPTATLTSTSTPAPRGGAPTPEATSDSPVIWWWSAALLLLIVAIILGIAGWR